MGKRDSDMDRYLDKVSRSSSRFINLHDVMKDKDDEDIVVIKEKTPFTHFISKILNSFRSKPSKDDDVSEEDIEEPEEREEDTDIDEVEDDLEEVDDLDNDLGRKPSFFERLFSFGRKDYEDDITEEIDEEEWRDDLKKVALLTKDLLKKVPVNEIKKLKDDGRFEEYKDILRRNGLLKE